MPALQLTADDHLSRRVDAVDLKHRFSNVETDRRDRLHAWLPNTATAPAAIASMALTCRRGSRPQHHQRTPGLRAGTERPTQPASVVGPVGTAANLTSSRAIRSWNRGWPCR